MDYTVVVITLFASLSLLLPGKFPTSLRILSIIFIIVSYVLIYLYASDELAQDRGQYYKWYVWASEASIGELLSSRDFIFSFLLTFIPNELSEAHYRIVFACIIICATLSVLWLSTAGNYDRYLYVGLILLLMVSDRFFLGLTCSTSRSALSAIIFIMGYLSIGRSSKYLIWTVALGVHVPMTLLMLALHFLTLLLKRVRFLTEILFAVGVCMFILRLFNISFIPNEITHTLAQYDVADSIKRGLVYKNEFSITLAIQVLLSIVAPLSLVLFNDKTPNSVRDDKSICRRRWFRQYALVSGAVFLSVYPDLSLAKRIVIVPMIAGYVLLPTNVLRIFVLVKVCIISIVLYKYM